RADPSEAGDHGRVIAEAPVAVELGGILDHHGDVIAELGALRVTSDAYGVPGGETVVDLAEHLRLALAQFAYFLGDIRDSGPGGGRVLGEFEGLDLVLGLGEGLFELKGVWDSHASLQNRHSGWMKCTRSAWDRSWGGSGSRIRNSRGNDCPMLK